MPPKSDQLDNVSLKLKANVYFDGGVVSHTAVASDGSRQTLGIIRQGKYQFKTEAPEQMDLIAGTCRVKLEHEKEWKTYRQGQTFHVPGKSSFEVTVDAGITEYLCTFQPQ